MKEVRIQVAAARQNFAKVLSRAAKSGTRIKVVRYGTTLAGIVPSQDLKHLKECEELLASSKGRGKRPATRGKRPARTKAKAKTKAKS